jgi:tetratricopeptide (TPR) repeat protein
VCQGPFGGFWVGQERARGTDDLEKALTGFRAALAAGHPEPATCHAECGACLEELGNWRGAVAEYGRAVALEPACGLHRYSRGYALQKIGKFTAAAADAAAAVELNPEDGDAATLLAELHLEEAGGIGAKEAARRQAVLSGEQFAVVEELGGLDELAGLLAGDDQNEDEAVRQAAAALLAVVHRQPNDHGKPPPAHSGTVAHWEVPAGAAGRSGAVLADPEARRWVEEAKVREEAMALRKRQQKISALSDYKQQAIACEREREARQAGRPLVVDDMTELARLQRRAAEAITGSMTQALAPAPTPAEAAGGDDPLARAQRLVSAGPAAAAGGDDWRSQLSDAGQAALSGAAAAEGDGDSAVDPVLARARVLLAGGGGEIVLGDSSDDDDEGPAPAPVPGGRAGTDGSSSVEAQFELAQQLMAAGQLEAARQVATAAKQQAEQQKHEEQRQREAKRAVAARARQPPAAASPMEVQLAALAAGQQETVQGLASAIRDMLEQDKDLTEPLAGQGDDWRAQLSDAGQAALSGATAAEGDGDSVDTQRSRHVGQNLLADAPEPRHADKLPAELQAAARRRQREAAEEAADRAAREREWAERRRPGDGTAALEQRYRTEREPGPASQLGPAAAEAKAAVVEAKALLAEARLSPPGQPLMCKPAAAAATKEDGARPSSGRSAKAADGDRIAALNAKRAKARAAREQRGLPAGGGGGGGAAAALSEPRVRHRADVASKAAATAEVGWKMAEAERLMVDGDLEGARRVAMAAQQIALKAGLTD